MNQSQILNLYQKQFLSTMAREKQLISDYYTKSVYEVFFRSRDRDSIDQQDKVKLYYNQTTPLEIGTTIEYKSSPYILVSKDAVESETFYSSVAVKCDTSLLVYDKESKTYKTVPVALDKNKNSTLSNGTISIVDGNVLIFTSETPLTKSIAVNNAFYCFGGYYKVANLFYNNNLIYIYLKREITPSHATYKLSYDGITSIDKATSPTYQVKFTAYKNDNIVPNPILQYSSLNEPVATVSPEGLVTFHQEGQVTLRAIWTDGDSTSLDVSITVSDSGAAPRKKITLKGRNNIAFDYSRTITAVYTDESGVDVSDAHTTEWTITGASFDTSLIKQVPNGVNRITLSYSSPSIRGKTFTLTAKDVQDIFPSASMNMSLE